MGFRVSVFKVASIHLVPTKTLSQWHLSPMICFHAFIAHYICFGFLQSNYNGTIFGTRQSSFVNRKTEIIVAVRKHKPF